jgi:DNA repair ATPase RecN
VARARKGKKIKKDYVAILLEDLRSQFRIFGEDLESVRRKGEATFSLIEQLQKKVDGVTLEMGWVKAELQLVKLELAELKKLFTRKAEIERLEALEKEVARLEKLIMKLQRA